MTKLVTPPHDRRRESGGRRVPASVTMTVSVGLAIPCGLDPQFLKQSEFDGQWPAQRDSDTPPHSESGCGDRVVVSGVLHREE
jgi:hypothetical protein